MAIIKKILVGIDGSEGSYKAAEFAAELASRFEASVTLMYVAAESDAPRYTAKPTFVPQEEILAGERLDRAKKIMEGRKLMYETAVEMGDPAQTLLRKSKEGYDLIVVGSRGTSGVREFLMGSVSSRVVQHSEVPVAVVP